MSNTLLSQYKNKFTKALEFIADDLRLSEDEVQELLTWMARTTRSRLFRPAQYTESVQTKDIPDSNSFEHVFIPELDELNTKSRPKEKKNETLVPAVTNTRPKLGSGVEKGKQPTTVVPVSRKTAGGTKPQGSAKSPVPKLARIPTQQSAQKTQAADKAKKAPAVSKTTALATKTNTLKQVPARPGIKPNLPTTKPSKSKN